MDTPRAQEFRKNILTYNGAFAFGEIQGNFRIPQSRGPQTIKLQGIITHLVPQQPHTTGQDPSPGQIYFIEDVDTAIAHRLDTAQYVDLNAATCRDIETEIRQNNVLAQTYHYIMEYERSNLNPQESELPCVSLRINPRRSRQDTALPHLHDNDHTRHISGLVLIAAVIAGDAPHLHPDVIIYPRNAPKATQRLHPESGSTDNLCYPLFHIHDKGGITECRDFGTRRNIGRQQAATRPTINDYYRYRLRIRPGEDNLMLGGKLF